MNGLSACASNPADAGQRAATVLLSPGNASSLEEVAAFISLQYGLTAQLTKLRSERDENYRVVTADGEQRLLKVSHAAEDPAIVDFQSKALLHVAAMRPDVPVQRLLPSLSGDFETSLRGTDGLTRRARMLTYLSGTPVGGQPYRPRLAASLGVMAARLDLALSGFHHPAEGYELLWDIQHAAKTRELLGKTESRSDRELCLRTLDAFEARVAPRFGSLRSQVIHNDLNPHNLLIDAADSDHVTGIIDFGDMVHAPLINEVAVASAYLLAADETPLGLVAEFVSAYHSILPLKAHEIAILPQLIAVRHAVTIAITNWRAAKYPENRDYILRNQRSAIDGLNKLFAFPEEFFRRSLLEACSMPAT